VRIADDADDLIEEADGRVCSPFRAPGNAMRNGELRRDVIVRVLHRASRTQESVMDVHAKA
jgi:hypothetical protein